MRVWMLPFCLGLCPPSLAGSAVLHSVRDNTLYEDSAGGLSNGAGSKMFAGTSGGGHARRALVAFDLSSIPPGSVVTSAGLRLVMTMTHAGSNAVDLRRTLAAWGEGASFASQGQGAGDTAQPGDATWLHRHWPDAYWTTPGGDYAPASSATLTVGSVGAYTWTSPGVVADVQRWVNFPATNFGWTIVADESFTPSAKRFETRETLFESERPRLTIEYLPPCPGDVNADRAVSFDDLNILLGQYSTEGEGLAADLNFDEMVDFADLNILLGRYGASCE